MVKNVKSIARGKYLPTCNLLSNMICFCSYLKSRMVVRRNAVTLVELLLAMSVMSMMVVALGTLTAAVQQSGEYTRGVGMMVRHAQVAMERIERTIAESTATAEFPGVAVFIDTVEGVEFPDTLVVWHPETPPVHPNGPPLFRELVIYCPDPGRPNRLLEITIPNDHRLTPPVADVSQWLDELDSIKTSGTSNKVELTSLLRAAELKRPNLREMERRRGCIRFELMIRPSALEWLDHQAGKRLWKEMSWVNDIYTSNSGLRQSLCRIEMQLQPEQIPPNSDPKGNHSLPFFGSAVRYYNLSTP